MQGGGGQPEVVEKRGHLSDMEHVLETKPIRLSDLPDDVLISILRHAFLSQKRCYADLHTSKRPNFMTHGKLFSEILCGSDYFLKNMQQACWTFGSGQLVETGTCVSYASIDLQAVAFSEHVHDELP